MRKTSIHFPQSDAGLQKSLIEIYRNAEKIAVGILNILYYIFQQIPTNKHENPIKRRFLKTDGTLWLSRRNPLKHEAGTPLKRTSENFKP